mgnify:CR=1 FL=1
MKPAGDVLCSPLTEQISTQLVIAKPSRLRSPGWTSIARPEMRQSQECRILDRVRDETRSIVGMCRSLAVEQGFEANPSVGPVFVGG